MEILQTSRFKRVYKKLHRTIGPQNQRAPDLLNAALQEIIDNPEIGGQKKEDLSWLRVHKFQMVNRLTLIGYCVEPEFSATLLKEVTLPKTERRLTFVDIGSHEHFYRGIK
jgi:hypothetical protein